VNVAVESYENTRWDVENQTAPCPMRLIKNSSKEYKYIR